MEGSNINSCIGTCKTDSVMVKVGTSPSLLCAILAVKLTSLAVNAVDSLEGLPLENWCLGSLLQDNLEWCLEPSFCLCSVFGTRSVILGTKVQDTGAEAVDPGAATSNVFSALFDFLLLDPSVGCLLEGSPVS